MNFDGADVVALRAAAARLDNGAETLEHLTKVVHSQMNNVGLWRGSDADRFRSQWASQSSPSIKAAVEALRLGANDLRRNADEQEKASDAGAPAGGSRVGATGSRAPTSTAEFLKHIQNSENDKYDTHHDGVRIEQVVGPDGKSRLIVYMKGVGTSQHRNTDQAADALGGFVDPAVVAAIKEALASSPEGNATDIMLVGLSEGGYDAQNIAAHSNELGLNVTNVVSYGAAVNQHDQPGIDTVHLNANWDQMVGVGTVGKVFDGMGSNLDLAGDQSPSSSNHVFYSDSGINPITGQVHSEGGYEQVAKNFDGSDDSRFADAKQSMKNFQGEIVKTYE
jgi:uncharacterized protein YukE